MSNLEKYSDDITDFGFAMVRPDGYKLCLDPCIIDRITEAGLEVILRKTSVITDDQVDSMYPDIHSKSYYPSMKAAMVGRHAMSLIIGGSHDVAIRLQAIKGNVDDEGGTIRGDYSGRHTLSKVADRSERRFYDLRVQAEAASRQEVSTPELRSFQAYWRYFVSGTTEPEIEALVENWRLVHQEDRLHTDASPFEAARSIRVMFSSDEIVEASGRYPCLQGFIDHNSTEPQGRGLLPIGVYGAQS